MALDYCLIGERLQKARKAKKITQEQLAEKIDVSVAFLSRIERGDIKINLYRLDQICTLLDVSIGNILSGSTSSSKNYLSNDFSNLLKSCPPEKSKLIYEVAKVIANQ